MAPSRLTLLAILLLPGTSVAAPPSVTLLFPPVIQVGQTAEITVSGADLGTIQKLVSVSGSLKTMSVTKSTISVEATAATAATTSIDAWTMTSTGLSNPRSLLLVPHPVVVAKEQDDESPTVIPLPGTAAARLDRAADRDLFEFAGRADQVVHVTCRSHLLDGSVLPVVTLFDSDGSELAHSKTHDREPTITYKLPTDGIYRARVADRRFAFDASSIYTLTIEAGPRLVTTRFSAIQTNDRPIELLGHGLPGGTIDPATHLTSLMTEHDLPTNSPFWPDRRPVSTLDPGFRVNAPGSVGTAWVTRSHEPVVLETEAENDTASHAQPLKWPARASGRFERAGDIDWYVIDAKKGQDFEVVGWGDRLGRAMRIEAIVHDDKGKALTTIGSLAAPKKLPITLPLFSYDPHGTWKAPADGRYTIVVRDIFGGSLHGASRHYQLVVAPPRPRFAAFFAVGDGKSHSGPSLHVAAKTTLTVAIVRLGGHAAPIEISAEALPEGVTALPLLIPAGKNSGTLTLEATDQAQVGITPIRLLAKHKNPQAAKPGDKSDTQAVLPIAHLPGPNPTHRIADGVPLAVLPPNKPTDKAKKKNESPTNK